MKTTKLFLMAALALTFAACSNDDNDAAQPAKGEGITITAKLAPKSDGAATRAVAECTNKITVTWAVNEQIAILYEVNNEKKVAAATITAVDNTIGAATISFSVADGTPDKTSSMNETETTKTKERIMSAIKDVVDEESARWSSGIRNEIHLYREGSFLRAYLWSAWLSLLPLTESKERQRRDEIPPTRVNGTIYARKRNERRARHIFLNQYTFY